MLLLLRRASPTARPGRLLHRRPTLRRGFFDFQPLADGFITLANTLPIPPDWPQYTTTIIVGTVAARTVFTLPFVLWSRRKARKLEEVVHPELSEAALALREQVRQDVHDKKGTYEDYKQEMSKQLMAKRKELLAKHGTSPLAMRLVPLAVHIPLFLMISVTLRQAAASPVSPLARESFLTIESLASTDTSGVLPIAFGLLTMVNVEMIRQPPSPAGPLPPTLLKLLWSRRRAILDFVLRFTGIIAIPMALNMPGAVVIYWITSGLYTFTERLTFTTLDQRRARAVKAKQESAKQTSASLAIPPSLRRSPVDARKPIAATKTMGSYPHVLVPRGKNPSEGSARG
ncbi:hypothetical protein CALCODRAFT_54411 [Calocera cornea HHB12733]|uniref:Membrane insertase YidC/Oxa/ALB C-terminal domain-containing protein n=1 Tax=Calocera cornea HHB12733 TaxID=1353952 RepID=A0A165DRI0_9BASI|nr:hypothetical protein CALCODRAFT_54411 [Calocera cornea HHB12733]